MQISLIKPFETAGQAADRSKTPHKSQHRDDGATSFNEHYKGASDDAKTYASKRVNAAKENREAEDTRQDAPGVDQEDANTNASAEAASSNGTDGSSHAAEQPFSTEGSELGLTADGTEEQQEAEQADPSALSTAATTGNLETAISSTGTKGADTAVRTALGAAAAGVVRNIVAEGGAPHSNGAHTELAIDSEASDLPKMGEMTKATQTVSQSADIGARAAELKTQAAQADVARKVSGADNLDISRSERHPPSTGAQPQAASAANAVQTIQVAANTSTVKLQSHEKENSTLGIAIDEAEGQLLDLRSSSSTGSTTTPSQPMRADLPRGVMFQLTEFARAAQDKPVHVSLNPEELGKVRMSVSTSENGVTLLIVAEKPETLDLMRRNLDQITREMASAGFTELQLSFGGGESAQSGEDGTSDKMPEGGLELSIEEASLSDENSPPLTSNNMATTAGGLDLRL